VRSAAKTDVDVAILGGGLAGNLLARQLTRTLPGLRIARAGRVRRTVEREGGQATAVDTLVRAERPAG